MLWLTGTAALGLLWSQGRGARVAAGVSCAFLGLGLALTIDQRSFLKGDLNRLTTEEHARELVAAHCTLNDARPAVRAPHLRLKRLLFPHAPAERFVSERWQCTD